MSPLCLLAAFHPLAGRAHVPAAAPPVVTGRGLAGRAAGSLSHGRDTVHRADSTTIHLVRIEPQDSMVLATQLAGEVAAARVAGELPIVYLTDPSICPPCRALEEAMTRPALIAVFQHIRLIEVVPSDWRNEMLGQLGYCGDAQTADTGAPQYTWTIPRFFTLDAKGHATGKPLDLVFGGADADAWAEALVPQFTTFFAAVRARRH